MATKKKTNEESIEETDLMDEEVEEVVIEVPDGEPTIDDLPGVGPATAEKLVEAGFNELLSIAVMSPE